MIGTRFKFDGFTWVVIRPIKPEDPDFGWVAKKVNSTQEKWFMTLDLDNKV